jgi:hypothetical protein
MVTKEIDIAVTAVMTMARLRMKKIAKARDEIISRALKDLF